MSVHLIYYQQGHKMMEAVATEEAYRRYRDSQTQARLMEAIRHPKPETDVSAAKRKLVQFTYQPRAPFAAPRELRWHRRAVVWRNTPPAGVWELQAVR